MQFFSPHAFTSFFCYLSLGAGETFSLYKGDFSITTTNPQTSPKRFLPDFEKREYSQVQFQCSISKFIHSSTQTTHGLCVDFPLLKLQFKSITGKTKTIGTKPD